MVLGPGRGFKAGGNYVSVSHQSLFLSGTIGFAFLGEVSPWISGITDQRRGYVSMQLGYKQYATSQTPLVFGVVTISHQEVFPGKGSGIYQPGETSGSPCPGNGEFSLSGSHGQISRQLGGKADS